MAPTLVQLLIQASLDALELAIRTANLAGQEVDPLYLARRKELRKALVEQAEKLAEPPSQNEDPAPSESAYFFGPDESPPDGEGVSPANPQPEDIFQPIDPPPASQG